MVKCSILVCDQPKEIYLDGYLKNVLDSLVYNVSNDWDFIIIVTGDGMVRTGKSVLAMNIAAYLAHKLKTPFWIDNIFFDSTKMISEAQRMPPHSVLVYDEARDALANTKRFMKIQQDLIDFFNECGQLNHIFVLVLPDFFVLNRELATLRSELLINVYRSEEGVERRIKGTKERLPVTIFKRGYFELFNRKAKLSLYELNKRKGMRNYQLIKPSMPRGRFTNNYPINEEEYRLKKREMLKRFDQRHKEAEKQIHRKYDVIRNQIIRELHAEGRSHTKIVDYLQSKYGYSISKTHVCRILQEGR